jgi:hypothetical protein
MEKAQTKAMIEIAERTAVEVLIPIARVSAATLMTRVGYMSNGLEPTRYGSAVFQSIKRTSLPR